MKIPAHIIIEKKRREERKHREEVLRLPPAPRLPPEQGNRRPNTKKEQSKGVVVIEL